MAKVILIKTSGDLFKAIKTLNRIRILLPKMTKVTMMNWGHVLVKDMKNSVKNAGIKDFTGTLQGKGIRWEQPKRSDTGFLFMRLYGIYLDSMAPHFVSVNRRRSRLLSWAKQASSSNIRRKARMVESKNMTKFSLYVKPHPFIASGFRTARPKLRPMINRSNKIALKVS